MVDLAGFALSVGINAAIAAVIFSIFLYCRTKPYNRYVYQPRTLHPAFRQGRIKPPDLDTSWFKWMYTVYNVDKETLLASAGLDAYMFIRFLELCLHMFAGMTILGIGILLPINYTANGGQDQFEAISMSNIPENGYRLAAPVIVAYFFAFWSYFLLTKTWMEYQELRLAFLAQEHLANRGLTLLVENIPDEAKTDKAFLKTFRSFFPTIDAHQPILHSSALSPSHVNHWDEAELASPTTPLTSQSGGLPQLVHSAFIAKDVGDLEQYVQDGDAALNNLEHALATYQNDPSERPMTATKYFCCDKQDAINYYTDEIKKENTLIKEKRIESLPYYDNGFVTFESVLAYQNSALGDKTSEPFAWKCKPAPELRDVYWPNLSYTQSKRTYMYVIIGILTWALVFFWIIPVAFIQAVANLENLPQKVPFLSFVDDIPSGLLAIIDGFLPGLILTIFNILLPAILLLMSKLEGIAANSWLQQAVLDKFYIFQVVNNFFFSTVGTAILAQFSGFISDPTSIVTYLGISIPTTATFFITYMLFNTLSVYPMSMLNPGGLIVGWLKKRFVMKTARDLIGIEAASAVNYGIAYPINLFSFIIAITFSVIAPIILPFAALYFAIGVWVSKYQYLYTNNTPFETGGQFWPRVFKKIIFSMIVGAAVFTALLGIKKSVGGAVSAAPLIIAPYVYKRWMEGAYMRKCTVLPLQAAVEVDREREIRRRRGTKQGAKTQFIDETGHIQDFGYNQNELRNMGPQDILYPHEHLTLKQGEEYNKKVQQKDGTSTPGKGTETTYAATNNGKEQPLLEHKDQTNKSSQQQQQQQGTRPTLQQATAASSSASISGTQASQLQSHPSSTDQSQIRLAPGTTHQSSVSELPNNTVTGTIGQPPAADEATHAIAMPTDNDNTNITGPKIHTDTSGTDNTNDTTKNKDSIANHSRLNLTLLSGSQVSGELPPPVDYIQPCLIVPKQIPIPSGVRTVTKNDTIERLPEYYDDIQLETIERQNEMRGNKEDSKPPSTTRTDNNNNNNNHNNGHNMV